MGNRSPGGVPRSGAALLALILLFCTACSDAPPGEGARLYVASGFTDQVFVLDPDDGRVLDSIDVRERPFSRDEPHGLAVAPDGRRWYLTLAHGEPVLQVRERPGNRLIGALPLPMGGASRIGLVPDGSVAFVPDYGRSAGDRPGEVARIRTRTLEITHRAHVCPAPHDAKVDPRGELVLVTCAYGTEAVLVSTADLSEVARVDLSPPGAGETRPMNAAWSADGGTAWITLMGAGQVVELDRSGRVEARVDAGPQPVSPALTPDGRSLLVTNRKDRSLSVFAVPGLADERRIALGDAPHPQGVALDGSGAIAYVSHEGEVGEPGGVVAVRIDTGEILWHTRLGAYVLGIAWAPPVG